MDIVASYTMLVTLLTYMGLGGMSPDRPVVTPSGESLFQLPITYGDPTHIHAVGPNLVTDLEMVETTHVGSVPIYDHLFQPSHPWARDNLRAWSRQFSTDMEYLTDTQDVIMGMGQFQDRVGVEVGVDPGVCTRYAELWESLHDPDFLEKYQYMEWDMLKHLNESPLFLQVLSVGNILSPVISLLVPILFLVFPFIILKLQGIAITMEVYIQVLQEIAKNHFIGKAIAGIQSMSIEKLIYVGLMFGLYLMQIYQNIMVCVRFHEHTRQLNRHLLELRSYVGDTLEAMSVFVQMHGARPSYMAFCQEVERRRAVLEDLLGWLAPITPFSISLSKGGQLGTMLRAYYELWRNREFQDALQYSTGFHGYIDNLRGVYRHWTAGHMAAVSWGAGEPDPSGNPAAGVAFQDQYYPALLGGTGAGEGTTIIKNDLVLGDNMILTGPNASGKTTYLKTTALNILFTQQVGMGFYTQGRMAKPYTHIHSYLNIPDTSERDSLFQAEARRCKDILDIMEVAGPEARHFCIFDELYSGTNPKEAGKAAYAFLKYLASRPGVDFILTTHYTSMCRKFRRRGVDRVRVQNFQMQVEVEEGGKIKYTYRIGTGISKVEGAVRILEDMHYPREIMVLLA